MNFYQNILTSLRFIVISIALLGIIYPVLLLLLGQTIFPHQANGSLLRNRGGKVLGSALIGQKFHSNYYFSSRPSLINYNPINLTPSNNKQLEEHRIEICRNYIKYDPLKSIPIDFVTNSASGLDPHISLSSAYMQISSIEKFRNISSLRLQRLIKNNTEGRFLSMFGEEKVNVLKLNIDLDRISHVIK